MKIITRDIRVGRAVVKKTHGEILIITNSSDNQEPIKGTSLGIRFGINSCVGVFPKHHEENSMPIFKYSI